jgi:hypothetical protein
LAAQQARALLHGGQAEVAAAIGLDGLFQGESAAIVLDP